MLLAAALAPRRGNRGPGGITLLAALALLALATPAFAGNTTKDGPEIRQGPPELSWVVPYQAGKVPVVFIHGFLGSHVNWTVMMDSLSVDPTVRAHFQLLTFEYDCLQPIPESGHKLLAALDDARRRFDPEGRDSSFDRVVLVGHSLGGLVAKAAALGANPQPPAGGELPASAPRQPVSPRVGRIVFVATPHRGTAVDQGAVRSAAIWFARSFNSLSPTPRAPSATPAGDRATSVDQLTWDHPLLADLQRAGAATGIPCHSIVATVDDPSAKLATDGLVPVASAHLDNARSELLVRTNHFCFQHREVIDEVRRVLIEHTAGPVNDALIVNQRTR